MKSKKIAAVILSLSMIAGAMPGMVLAEEIDPEEPAESVEQVQEEEAEAPEGSEESDESGESEESGEEEAVEQADIYSDPNSSITFANGTLTLAGDVNRTAIDAVVEDQDTIIHINALPGTRIVPDDVSWKALFEYMHNVTDIDLSNVTLSEDIDSLEYFFSSCESLTSIVFPDSFDTSNVKNMNGLFFYCFALESIEFGENFDTSSVEIMSGMFSDCQSLKSLDLSMFDTSSVTTMNSMFSDCSLLSSLDLSGFDTGKVESMAFMFERCSNLKELRTGKLFDTSSVLTTFFMFNSCSSLESIYASKAFDLSSAETTEMMFIGCTSLPGYDANCTDGTYARANSPEGLGYLIVEQAEGVVGYSLTLDDSIGINFYVYLDTDDSLTASYDWGTGIDARSGNSYVHSDVPAVITAITDEEESSLYSGANYKITCHVAARAMTDDVDLTVKSGSSEILTDSYRVVDYMGDALKIYPDDVNLHFLLNVMFIYGDQAQKYFEYRTDDPAADYIDYTGIQSDATVLRTVETIVDRMKTIEDMSEEIDVPDSDMTVRNIDPSKYGLSFYGSSLSGNSSIKVRLYFKIKDTALADSTDIQLASSARDRFRLSSVDRNGSYLVVNIDLVNPGELGNAIQIRFNNGNNFDILNYNSLSYASAVFSPSAGGELKKVRGVVDSMMFYSDTVTVYRDSH